MKATIQSTDQIVTISDPDGRIVMARVWEGTTEAGIPFVAYITSVQVCRDQRAAEFERDLLEHKRPAPETERAINLRFVI